MDSTGDDALAQIIYKYTGRRDQVVEEDSSVEDSSVYELSMKKPQPVDNEYERIR